MFLPLGATPWGFFINFLDFLLKIRYSINMRKQFRLTKFFEFQQNNSGGEFIFDHNKGIGVNVIIEAFNADHANKIAIKKGLYFNGVICQIDCGCCGDRWQEAYGQGHNMITWSLYYDAYIHFLDGKIYKISGV